MAALALGGAALAPAGASAVTRTATVAGPTLPKLLPTVDHPPADFVGSFDNGRRDSNLVALTFDADMTAGMLAQLQAGSVRSWYNSEVRELLDQEHVPATVFLTGLWAQTYPDVARSLAQDPLFEIGSHSVDHLAFRTPCYGLAGVFDRAAEIDRAQDQIQAASGVRPRLFRFPGDCYDRSDEALLQQRGMLVISGDVRAGDGFNPNAAAIAAAVINNAHGGSIVIMHIQGGPNAPMTGPALRLIIPALRARGLGFGTVSQVLAGAVPPPPAPATTAARLAAVSPLTETMTFGDEPAAVKLAHIANPLGAPKQPHRVLHGKGLLVA